MIARCHGCRISNRVVMPYRYKIAQQLYYVLLCVDCAAEGAVIKKGRVRCPIPILQEEYPKSHLDQFQFVEVVV